MARSSLPTMKTAAGHQPGEPPAAITVFPIGREIFLSLPPFLPADFFPFPAIQSTSCIRSHDSPVFRDGRFLPSTPSS
jgi:hypothetical protein